MAEFKKVFEKFASAEQVTAAGGPRTARTRIWCSVAYGSAIARVMTCIEM